MILPRFASAVSSSRRWMPSSVVGIVGARRGLSSVHSQQQQQHVDYNTQPTTSREPRFPPSPSMMMVNDNNNNAISTENNDVRHNWTREEIASIYHQPLIQLVYHAASVHRTYWHPQQVQQCTLLSIKTGGCTEDCSYCSQSVRHATHVRPTPTMAVDKVLQAAQRAQQAGSTRFCMGAAWRELGNKQNAFGKILDMVRGVNGMGMEVCCTLGMLTKEQAAQLKEAGLTAYNHNLDTSPEYYPKVVTTRSYEDRLQTIANVREAGINVCSGGILGLGEDESDRIGLLHTLANLPEHPESVPINALVKVEGTPLGDAAAEDQQDGAATGSKNKSPDALDMTRMIATARIVLPRTMVRLSAGRLEFTDGEQFLMFQAGANSIFNGDTLLTTPNPAFDKDQQLFARLGLHGKPAHQEAWKPSDGIVLTKTQADAKNHDQLDDVVLTKVAASSPQQQQQEQQNYA